MNDFGRQSEINHRFDDFAKLHESLSSIPSVSLPPLPPKNMFGGNDPKVVEERRPMLEKLMRECLGNEKVLTCDANDMIYKFLEIPHEGMLVVKFLCPSTRKEYLLKLPELIQGEASRENYRLFTEPVMKALLSVLIDSSAEFLDVKAKITALDVLQYILSQAHAHPLVALVDVQQLFVSLGGISIVWSLLAKKESEVRDNCRRVLSSLITSNSANIDKYEGLIVQFLRDQNGLSLLFESSSSGEKVDEIIGKLIWFGLSEEVQKIIANHSQGLALLGKLYSSPDVNARTLSGLTLSVLISSGAISDQGKVDRSIEGINSILSSLLNGGDKITDNTFLSSLCRGSPNGLRRMINCIEKDGSDFCSYVVLHANLAVETVDEFAIAEAMESALLNEQQDQETSGSSLLAQNASRFLFNLFSKEKRLPTARGDGKIGVLLAKIKTGIAEYNRCSRKTIQAEHGQIELFSKATLQNQVAVIEAKKVGAIDFSEFKSLVTQYEENRASLGQSMRVNSEAIAGLKSGFTSASAVITATVNPDLLKEWNHSVLGMQTVYRQLEALKQQLAEKECEAKSGEADSENLQQIVSKMRLEIMNVDSHAEEFRKESSRFSAAAAGALDPDLMLQRAADCEEKAKAEIAKREALRQSQDSLEAQLEVVRKNIVKAETQATETRKAIADTSGALVDGEQLHKALEERFRSDFEKTVLQWQATLSETNNQLAAMATIFSNIDCINKMIATENDQKDLLVAVIGDLVSKLQTLQSSLS